MLGKYTTKTKFITFAKLSVIYFLYSGYVWADKGDVFSMPMTIHGEVIASGKCSFEKNDQNSIDFGEVKYDPENGSLLESYIKDLSFNLSCSGDVGGSVMRFTTKTNSTVSDGKNKLLPVISSHGSVLSSLGIKILLNGVPTDVDKWITVDVENPPLFRAELVSVGDGKDLANGDEFSAGATLEIAFQ